MRYKFENKHQIVVQDIREWLSINDLCKWLKLEVPGDYTPPNYYRVINYGYHVQAVSGCEAEELSNSFECLLRTITTIEIYQDFDKHQHCCNKNENQSDYVGREAFLGYFHGDYFGSYFPLEYFQGENSNKIQELINFLRVGKFTIDWNPLPSA